MAFYFISAFAIAQTPTNAEGIGGRVKFLPLAWAGMPKTSFRKNSDSPLIDSWGFMSMNQILTLECLVLAL
jgi:hypothetical protein